jgi:hypothetical protein
VRVVVQRMGHLHHKALTILREIVTGLLEFNTEQHGVCKECTLGKYANVVFPSSEHRSKEILDLVHSDVSTDVSSINFRKHALCFLH